MKTLPSNNNPPNNPQHLPTSANQGNNNNNHVHFHFLDPVFLSPIIIALFTFLTYNLSTGGRALDESLAAAVTTSMAAVNNPTHTPTQNTAKQIYPK